MAILFDMLGVGILWKHIGVSQAELQVRAEEIIGEDLQSFDAAYWGLFTLRTPHRHCVENNLIAP